ncbi:DNA-directed RNA polymerase subunit omega [Acholeplasma vituli]|uniref:DNA-directed RNA polymerase subunit omega n=1 Tax=Paracholeplasma vituli TaxID=69473 RepID=A0ABT2PUA7_9MOLU|nr:DNA-directed RNA polymerase subunit omega [Paracholeplasma vituli]MCU0104534.1 DNA-directed RNA polymerase subunit omega [Paracholeplasma vituli]
MIEHKDGMRYPSIDALLEKVDSKYKLAYISAKRAKSIQESNDHSSIDKPLCKKPVGIALEEILQDKIQVEFVDKVAE